MSYLYNFYKSYWEFQDSPKHAHDSDEWYDKYAREVLFQLDLKETQNMTLLDLGCGSGKITNLLAPYFKSVVAVDYSEKMLGELEKNKVSNITTVRSDAIEFLEKNEQKFDVIVSKALVQYLKKDQVSTMIRLCTSFLKEKGTMLIQDIPNRSLRPFYIFKVFHEVDKQYSFMDVVKAYMKHKRMLFFRRLRHPRSNMLYNDWIGNWFYYKDYYDFAQENGLQHEFYNPMFFPYGYRFHVKMSKS